MDIEIQMIASWKLIALDLDAVEAHGLITPASLLFVPSSLWNMAASFIISSINCSSNGSSSSNSSGG